jgi:hypothetical protein
MPELEIKIKIIKAIKPEYAEKLRNAAIPVKFLEERNNSAFLYDELSEAPYSIIKCDFSPDKNDLVSIPPISGSLGTFTFPKFDFSLDSDDYSTLGIAAGEEICKKVPIIFDFKLKNKKNKLTPIAFELEINLDKENFKPKWYGNAYFSFSVFSSSYQSFIFNIAAYFYNKFNLYKKTRNFLSLKKNELINISNSETFVNTLLALFSAKKAENFKLEIPEKNLSKELILFPETDQIPNYKRLFKYMAYESSLIKDEETDRLEVFVGEKTNTLAIIFDLEYEKSVFAKKFRKKLLTDVALTNLKLDSKLDALINETLRESLENYLTFSDFSSKIISQVKTKFLLKTL